MVESLAPVGASRVCAMVTEPAAAPDPPADTSMREAITPPLTDVSEMRPPAVAICCGAAGWLGLTESPLISPDAPRAETLEPGSMTR